MHSHSLTLRRSLTLPFVAAFALLISATGWNVTHPGRLSADAGAAPAAPKAYIGLFKDNAVAVLDTGANRVLKTIPVPAGPHGMAITADGASVYVSSDGDSTVSVIDTATDAVTGTIQVGQMPHGLALTPDGRLLLVAGFGTSQVVLIDTASASVVGRVPVPSPHNIAVSPDGALAYVAAQQAGATSLAVIDLAARTQVASVPLTATPRALGFSADGKQLYFTEAGVDAVQVLDPATNTIVAQIPVGASPHHPLFTPDGEYALVVVQGPGTLAIVDPGSETVMASVKVGDMPHWIATTGDGSTAYVTNENSGDVSVVNLDSQQVTATIAVGNGPRKIVMQPIPASATAMMTAAATTAATVTAAPVTVAPSDGSGVNDVRISGFAFAPPSLTVLQGQTVTWTNADPVSHTTTSLDGLWDSGALPPGATFSFTFNPPGTYRYGCMIHPFMQGTITVTGA